MNIVLHATPVVLKISKRVYVCRSGKIYVVIIRKINLRMRILISDVYYKFRFVCVCVCVVVGTGHGTTIQTTTTISKLLGDDGKTTFLSVIYNVCINHKERMFLY